MARSSAVRWSGPFLLGSKHAEASEQAKGQEKADETKGVAMPTGPNCDQTFDQCVAWARQQDGIDDPEAYCAAREKE